MFSDSFMETLDRVSDPQNQKDGAYFDRINLRKVHNAGIPVALGTDAGNPGTIHGISIVDELEAMQ